MDDGIYLYVDDGPTVPNEAPKNPDQRIDELQAQLATLNTQYYQFSQAVDELGKSFAALERDMHELTRAMRDKPGLNNPTVWFMDVMQTAQKIFARLDK